MGLHMLAVFDRDTARAPAGLEPTDVELKSRPHAGAFLSEEVECEIEETCQETIEHVCGSFNKEHTRTKRLGHGNGYSFEAGPFCSFASRDGVHILFAGEVAAWPNVDVVQATHDAFIRGEACPEADDAHWLLDFYSSFKNASLRDITEDVLDALGKVHGQFAFVIYDEHQQRVLAARDREGTRPLHWGVTGKGQLMFGSDIADLDSCCDPSATAFPPGTLYASQGNILAEEPGEMGWVITGEQWPGSLLAYVKGPLASYKPIKAVPRVDSKGCLHGAVYRVDSQRELVQGAQYAC